MKKIDVRISLLLVFRKEIGRSFFFCILYVNKRKKTNAVIALIKKNYYKRYCLRCLGTTKKK